MKNNYRLLISLSLMLLATIQLNGNSAYDARNNTTHAMGFALSAILPEGNSLCSPDSLKPSAIINNPSVLAGTKSVELGTEPAKAASTCPVTVDAGPDQYFCNTFPTHTQLTGVTQGNVLYSFWEPSNFLGQPSELITSATVNQTTTYTLTSYSFDPDLNLIVNGDFEQGNVGFISEYTYSPVDLVSPATYAVLSNPNKGNPKYPICGDHTTGSGNMLATSLDTKEIMIWQQIVPVTPNTNYLFTGWNTRFTSIKPQLKVVINQSVTNHYMGLNCLWHAFGRYVNSGNSSMMTISIYRTATPLDAAVALDDLFLTPICEVKDSMTVHLVSVKAAAAPVTFLQPCEGATVTLHGTGTSTGPPMIYNWTTADGNIVSGENTLNPVVNAPGTYTFTVRADDPNYPDCSSTATVVVEENQSPISAWIAPGPALNCVIKQTTLSAGATTGFILKYQWTASDGGNIISGTTGKTVQVNAPGTYSVVITDTATGCTTEAEIEVPNDTTLPTAIANANPLGCVLQQSTLSGAGSSKGPDFVYTWSTPDGKILSGKDSLFALTDTVGTYILRVMNIANLCIATDTVLVTRSTTSPDPVLLPAEGISCLLSHVILSVDSISYNGPQLVYSWTTSPGGNIVSGGDSLAPIVNAPGLYTLLVTDTLNGCTGRDSVLVNADTSAIIAIANAAQPLTCTTLETQLDAIGSTNDPSLIYLWTTANGNIVSGADTPTPTVDAPGTYQLLLTNPNSGCTASDLAIVIQNTAPPPVIIQAAPPFSCLLSQQTLQGQNAAPGGMFSYQWTASNGGNIVSGENSLTPEVDATGTYTLLTTNQNTGCTSETAVQVDADLESPDAALSVSGNLNCTTTEVILNNNSATDPSLLNHRWTNPDGSIGNSGADPNWSASAAGEYLLLLTNTQNGCTSTATATVTANEVVSAEVAVQNDVTCFGATDGTLSVTGGGGNGAYTYLWENGETTPMIDNLAAGTYTVVITDGENCTATLSLNVDQPEAISVNASATALSAVGANDGTATASPTGGTGPYTYAWDNGETTQTIIDLPIGFYTVVITDANGCTATQTVEVTDGGCNLSALVTSSNPTCNGQSNGTATATPTGGATPLSYVWSSGATSQTANNLAAGTYEVIVTDANDCAFSATVTLSEPPELTLVPLEVNNTSCPGSAEGSATVEANGGTGNLSIEWNDGQQGPTATALIAGTYTATATDENGCIQTVEMTIEADDQEPPVLLANPSILPVGPAGSVTLTPQNLGLVVTDNCQVNGVVFSPESFNCLQLGVQQVSAIATDASGNSSSITFEVTVVDQEAPKVVCPPDIRRCFGDDNVEYAAPVATDNCLMLGGNFDLIEGLPSGVQFPPGTTTTTYTFTDVSGNVGSCSFQVTILSPLEVVNDAIIHDVGGQHTGSIQVTVSGSEPGYTYAWQQNGQTIATTEDLTGVGEGTYTLIVTDANGCSRTAGPYEVSDLVGTNVADWSELIALYPNPTAGKVIVVFPDALLSTDLHFSVFDARGRKVQDQYYTGQKQVLLDWTAFADGLYTLLIRAEKGQAVYRVVLDK